MKTNIRKQDSVTIAPMKRYLQWALTRATLLTMLALRVGSVSAQTPQRVPQFDPGGSGSLVDSAIAQSGDNVGIGTPLPQAKLDVNGNIYSFNTGIGQEGPYVSARNYQILPATTTEVSWWGLTCIRKTPPME